MICIALCSQLFEQATQSANFKLFQTTGQRCIVDIKERGSAKVTQQRIALWRVQDVVRVQVAVQDAS